MNFDQEQKFQSPENSQDENHLSLLVIFHYILAGMTGLFALFPIIHLVLGIAILSGGFEEMDGEAPPAFIGWMFVIIAGLGITFGLALATMMVFVGRNLSRRTGHLFCLIIAGIECTFVPFGTILGVFTIVVLSRPNVKRMFSATPPAKNNS